MNPDKNDNTLSKWLNSATHVSRYDLETRLKPLGVNTSQFFFILKLHDNPGITQDELVKTDVLHQSNVNREINQLVVANLVSKVQSTQDKRKYALSLTSTGSRLYPKVKAALTAHEQAMTDLIKLAVPDYDQTSFLQILKQISKLNSDNVS